MSSTSFDPSLEQRVASVIAATPITDIHTHLYPPGFGGLLLRGVDDLLTYHYLIAEMFRWRGDLDYDGFFSQSVALQAEQVWRTLFVEHSPVSESCRGVLTVLQAFGRDVAARDLEADRRFFAALRPDDHVDLAMRAANVETIVLTNDPFDDDERACWDRGVTIDARFRTALRIDLLFANWPRAVAKLRGMGFKVAPTLSPATMREVTRFLQFWIERMDPVYLMASLGPDFCVPAKTTAARLFEHVVLPVVRARRLPFAMMIGCKRQINPALRLAGDGVAPVNLDMLEYIAKTHADVKFMVTLLTRESQHGLCVLARKFRNVLPFGCWWFLNSPVFIEEMTRMRLQWLGTSMIPQHSDARVLDQIIYKWAHTKSILARVLAEAYGAVEDTGWRVSDDELRRDIADMFGGTFWRFIART